MTNSRENFGDQLRGLAIIGVVAIHSADLIISSSYLWITNYFRFCVPIFIFLSVFFAAKKMLHKRNHQEYILSKLTDLFIPYIFFSLVYFFLTAEDNLPFAKILTRHFLGYGWAGQYFFIVMFQLVIFYPLISRICVGTIGLSLLLMLFFSFFIFNHFLHSNFLDKLGDRPFIYWLPYFLLGGYLAQHEVAWKAISLKMPNWFLKVIFIIVPLLMIVDDYTFSSNFASAYARPSVLFSSVAIVLISYGIFYRIHSNFLEYLGRNSLVIFCLNPLFILLAENFDSLRNLIGELSNPLRFFLYPFGIVLVIFLSLLTGSILRLIGLRRVVSQ